LLDEDLTMTLAAYCVTALCLTVPAQAKMPNGLPHGLTVVDWTQIRAEYERHRHGMFPDGGGFKARSFEQQWLAHFDGRGFSLEPDHADWRWGLELVGVEGKALVSTDVNRINYRWSADLDEWFLNGTRGLEHGFTLKAHREIRLAVRGGLRARAAGAGVEFVDASAMARIKYSGLAAWDADGRTLPARMKVEGGLVTLVVDDRGAQYPIVIDPIAQQAYLKASNTGFSITDFADDFGLSVAVSGDTVVVGAYIEDSNATGVNGSQADNSAPWSGAAYVFVRSGATWTQQAYLKASNTGPSDFFGFWVAVSGDTVVVGAYGEDSNATGVNGNQADNSASSSGAAYVFVRSGVTWTQQAYLKASNSGADDTFGVSVAVSGDTVVVGARLEDSNATGVNGNQADDSALSSGAAYVFVRSGVTWTQQAYLKASNTGAADFFGYSVAASGDALVVGAYGEDSNATGVNGNQADNSASSSGAAYVFVRSGVTWTQQAYLKASNTDADDLFGFCVAVSGDTVAVGAYFEDSAATGVNGNQADNSAPSSGAAYVFVRSGVTWTQQAYLKASNTEADDTFGASVAVSGDTVVVGASLEDSNATGVNGNQADNSASGSGAAYVFVRHGVTWTQGAYLKASNTELGDIFGSVAVSGDTIVVGAWREDSIATGVNGNQADNSASDAGAAYVFLHPLSVTITSSPPGMIFSTSGAGCVPGGGYTTPQTLEWTPGSSCAINFGSPQTGPGSVPYSFHRWSDDNSTNPTRAITAPASFATYNAVFMAGLQPVQAGPSSGSGMTQTMSFDFHAPNGFASLSVVNVLINDAINGIGACYVAFVPSTGSLFLVDDAGNAGGPYAGMTLPGSGTIQNSQCSIDGTGSSVSGSGNALLMNLAITFKTPFAGNKVIYMASQDTTPSNSGWQTIGVWNIPGPVPPGPAVGGVSPGRNSSANQIYTFTFTDTNGFADLAVMNVLVNNAINGIAACYVAFVPSGPAAGSIYLVDDAGNASGPFAGMVLPGTGSVSNSQCIIDGTGSSVSGGGNTLTLTLNMTLKPTFAGNKVIYMAARSNTLNSGWQSMGTVGVP